jgi:oligopeptide/dipeptide ABC transporter ATP-binding protein
VTALASRGADAGITGGPAVTASGEPILRVTDLVRTFGGGNRLRREPPVRAVDGVSFDVAPREAFGLVGESGSGKTTIGRMVVRLLEPTSGELAFEGQPVQRLGGGDLLRYRRQVQMVFQNPYASLNPRRRVREVLEDALDIHGLHRGAAREPRLAALMEQVGLRPDMLERYPHQFSSGQRQRIVIARALSVEPSLIVADEPVSALDVSVQAQVLNLLRRLQVDLGLSVIFISHDLRAVSFLCDRIAVLYLGRVMEITPRRALVENPVHPYTRALFASIPSLVPGQGITRDIIRGDIGDAAPPLDGCVFAPRCELRRRLGDPERCITERPALIPVGPDHVAACHFTDAAIELLPDPREREPEPAGLMEATAGALGATEALELETTLADTPVEPAAEGGVPDGTSALPGPVLPQGAFPPADVAVPLPAAEDVDHPGEPTTDEEKR